MTDAARTDATLAPAAAPRATGAPSTHGGYLFGPLTDFIYLGGGSLIILGLIALFLPQGITEAQEFSLMMVLMLLINQPHFAHSYQMFYRNFGAKAFGPSYARSLRIRYVFAGIVVPLVLIAFLVFGVMSALESKSTEILGYAFNAMFFFVGWHYVKQGYGILIVDSVQKRQFFSENTKRIFRANAYFCWLLTWTGLNNTISKMAPQVGIAYHTLALPALVYDVMLAAGIASTFVMLAALAQCWRTKGTLPWNGVIAYLASLYVWVVFARSNPLVYVIIPTFHSLQYLAVVWRYQLNAAAEAASRKARTDLGFILLRLFGFVALGTLLGYLAMDAIPRFLDSRFHYDQGIFGPNLIYFAFIVFINIHHYFLDNVMWRRGNPDVQQYIFRP